MTLIEASAAAPPVADAAREGAGARARPESAPHTVEVQWDGGLRYSGGPAGGPCLELDGERRAAPSPIDAVLAALASCSAIDVVEFLQKRRTPAAMVNVDVRASRAERPPRRLTAVHLHFRVTSATERHHLERAITLSLEKYCSVAASLAADVELSWTADLATPTNALDAS